MPEIFRQQWRYHIKPYAFPARVTIHQIVLMNTASGSERDDLDIVAIPEGLSANSDEAVAFVQEKITAKGGNSDTARLQYFNCLMIPSKRDEPITVTHRVDYTAYPI